MRRLDFFLTDGSLEQTGADEVIIPEIVLPSNIYAVEGREANVYFDNLILPDADDYLPDAASSYGIHQNERWTWTPSSPLASAPLTVSMNHPQTGELLASKSTTIKAAAANAGSGTTLKCIFVGDSLINDAVITQTILDIAGTDAMGAVLYGTRGIAPNLHEGRGGWTIANYTSDYSTVQHGANPFWIGGQVDFPSYLAVNAIDTPDWVFIQLGTNDCFSQTNDAACSALANSAFNNLDTLIASIKAAGAGVKVGLMIPPPPSREQDSFGANYDASQSRWRFKRNILIWARQLISRYAGQEANRIYLVPSNTANDTTNNVSRAASAPFNSRTTVSTERQNNGVHPAASGYRQMADAVWAFLKCNA